MLLRLKTITSSVCPFRRNV